MNSTLHIEHATIDDARAVAQIHVDAWRAAYASILPAGFLASLSVDEREGMWRAIIAAGEPELVVARDGAVVRGWINFGTCRDAGAGATDGEIWALYVAPDTWSTGAGFALWKQGKQRLVARGCTTCSLWVFPQNERALRFYRNAGFTPDPLPPKSFELGGATLQEVRYGCTLTSD
jgi:ribosomal protein S18 acetylase RimI-like enzyme